MPRRRCLSIARGAAMAAACFSTTWARAGGGAATDAYAGIDREAPIDLHALVDVYAQRRFAKPSSGAVLYRAFDVEAGGASLGLARITVGRAPNEERALGFRVDAGVGDTANGYLREDPGAADDRPLARGLSYVQQAFVSARVPVGSGLTVDIGKLVTPIGLEDNESIACWSYSRSLLYTLAEPTMHTGARATYELHPKLAVSAFWLNGWNANVVGGDAMRSFAAAATLRPSDESEVAAVYSAGLERAPTRLDDPTLAWRHVLDAYAKLALGERLDLAVTVDYARDAAAGGVSFWGAGGAVRARALDWLRGTLRAEMYADPDGFTSGTRQRLVEVTATVDASMEWLGLRAIARLEYRHDHSDARPFPGSDGGSVAQDTLTLATIVAY